MELIETAHPVMNGYKMQTTYLLVVFAIVVQHTFAGTFPAFIQKCKVSDPKFDDCVLNSANDCMSAVFRGNEKYGISPPPLALNFTRAYNFSDNFAVKFINLSTNFFENFVITYIRFDFQKKLLLFGTRSPQAEYSGEYEADGDILGKPAHESGGVNMTFDHVEFNAVVTLDFKMKNEKKYLEAVSCVLVFNAKNFQFKPYDQVTVGEPMTDEQKKVYQSYIDELPAKFKKDEETYDKTILDILNSVFDLLPFEEIFIP